MIISKELKKKGKNGQTIANLNITQEGDMTVRIGSGPVFLFGEDYTLDSPSDYVVAVDPDPRFIAIYLVKRVSDGQCVVFVDEDYMGQPGYPFHESTEYEVMFKLGEIRVAGGATTLDDATIFMRRWIDRDELLAEEQEE